MEGLTAASLEDALHELENWYASLRDFDGLEADERLRLVNELDIAGRDYVAAGFAKFYASAHMRDRAERGREELLETYWTNLAGAYARCVADAEQHGKRFKDREQLPIALARSYRAQFLAAKMRCMLYLPAAPRDWKAVYRPLAFAELAHFDTQPVQIYAREMRTSVRGELAKILAFHMSAPHDLPPEQMELSAQIIDRVGLGFVWAGAPSKECPNGIDLVAGGPPHAVKAEEAPAETRRYFGAGPVLKHLAEMERQSGEDLLSESDARFAKSFTPTQIVTVLRHVARHLAADAPRRAAARVPAAETIEVVQGFAAICQRVVASEFSTPAAGSKDKLKLEAESADTPPQIWNVVDRSDWGLGATVPVQGASWPEPGILLGIRSKGERDWSVAILRRVDSTSTGMKLRCGLQLLSRKPLSVHLRVLGREGEEVANWESASGSFRYDYVRAIVLPDAPKAGNLPVMLLQGTKFVPKQICEIMMGERSRHIKLAEFLDQGTDYSRASFNWVAPAGKA